MVSYDYDTIYEDIVARGRGRFETWRTIILSHTAQNCLAVKERRVHLLREFLDQLLSYYRFCYSSHCAQSIIANRLFLH